MPQISIIIRTKNEEDSVGMTLQGIFRQKGDLSPEVLVIDSGSTDRTLEIAGTYPVKIITIPPSDFTYGHALNRGIRESSGKIACLLSAHSVPEGTEWLAELVKPITGGTAHATYGRQIPVKGVNPFEEVSLSRHFPETERAAGRVPFSNANCAFLRQMWEKVQFDEKLTSWEDYLWYILLKDSYTFRYCPRAAVSHSHPFSVRDIVQRRYNDGMAFRMIKDTYGIDVVEDLYPGMTAKLRMFLSDMASHAVFFSKKGYKKYILLIPVVRICAYFTYWRGFRSAG
ncbi:MAG: glycosyltransferase [Nitrospirota bacterium]